MLEASIAPSAPPARTDGSDARRINRITSLDSTTSAITFLIRSSNSPRYLEPATMPDRSSVITRLSAMTSGTFPDAIIWANPSATAVFPTPGSPMRQGYSWCGGLRSGLPAGSHFSRPITGSSFPSAAIFVRFLAVAVQGGSGICPVRPVLAPCISSFTAGASSPMAARRSI